MPPATRGCAQPTCGCVLMAGFLRIEPNGKRVARSLPNATLFFFAPFCAPEADKGPSSVRAGEGAFG